MGRHGLCPAEPTAQLAPLTITIGGIEFDHHRYDERGDVLYLNVGEPRPAARGLETDDGHGIHFAADGAVIGLTLVNVRWTLEQTGQLTLTWPSENVRRDDLDAVLAGA